MSVREPVEHTLPGPTGYAVPVDWLPAAAMAAVTDKFHAAPVTPVVLDARTLGDRADHVRWARTPAAVVATITDWLANVKVNHTPS